MGAAAAHSTLPNYPHFLVVGLRNNHRVWGLGAIRPRSGERLARGLCQRHRPRAMPFPWPRSDSTQPERWGGCSYYNTAKLLYTYLPTSLQNYKPFDTVQTTLFVFLDTEARSLLLTSGHDTFSQTQLSRSQRNTKVFLPARGVALPSLPIGSVAVSRKAIAWRRAGWANTGPASLCLFNPVCRQAMASLEMATEPIRRQGKATPPVFVVSDKALRKILVWSI